MAFVMHCSGQKSHLKWILIYLWRSRFNFRTQSAQNRTSLKLLNSCCPQFHIAVSRQTLRIIEHTFFGDNLLTFVHLVTFGVFLSKSGCNVCWASRVVVAWIEIYLILIWILNTYEYWYKHEVSIEQGIPCGFGPKRVFLLKLICQLFTWLESLHPEWEDAVKTWALNSQVLGDFHKI